MSKNIVGLVILWGLVIFGMVIGFTGIIKDDTSLIIAGGFITTIGSIAIGVLNGNKVQE